ncbi:hypothetical protein GGE66_001388 [Rhizobium leguminosarum]|uniref:Uncharacterized protein n=1 Tax=Rhizobium leguminosarum TaxID=384 RepID=A0A7X0DSA3_RHILE|nr:hypothetical protein [Rhizobium leguminosarum]
MPRQTSGPHGTALNQEVRCVIRCINGEFGKTDTHPPSSQALSLGSMAPAGGAGVGPRVKPEDDGVWGEPSGKLSNGRREGKCHCSFGPLCSAP